MFIVADYAALRKHFSSALYIQNTKIVSKEKLKRQCVPLSKITNYFVAIQLVNNH